MESLTRPKKIEKPSTNRFLVEFKSTNCKLDKPTAVIIENMTTNNPPMIGSGMSTKMAPNFDKIPKIIMTRAPHWMTLRLPT